MSLQSRVEYYRAIEKIRARPLVTYVTSSRASANGTMAGDVVPEIVAQLQMLPRGTDQLDLLLASNGGDATVAWRIVCLIRERVSRFSVLVPSAAFSAATLVALGANEIVMHPYGNLGPVDPQIRVSRPSQGGQMEMHFGSEDLASFLDFARSKVGLSDQAQLLRVFELFCNEVGPVPIGSAARAAHLSLSLGKKLLSMHMTGDGNDQRVRSIAEKLSREFFHHGYALGRKEAKDIGLTIADENAELEELMWKVWLDFESELELRRPFQPLELVKQNAAAGAVFAPVAQVIAPVGMNAQIPAQVVSIPPTDFELTHACVESSRAASRFAQRGMIFAAKRPDLQVVASVVPVSSGWENLVVPPEPEIKMTLGHPPAVTTTGALTPKAASRKAIAKESAGKEPGR